MSDNLRARSGKGFFAALEERALLDMARTAMTAMHIKLGLAVSRPATADDAAQPADVAPVSDHSVTVDED